MAVGATVLFAKPQAEIASLIAQRMAQSTATSIVTGFATPSGVDAIAAPIIKSPQNIASIVVGAATYPGFEALDELIARGVPRNRVFIHLGHTRPSGGKKHPTTRFHPMLHSKIYFMELPDNQACAFVGSHNVTQFALTGLNGEASVLLEGPSNATEFDDVRQHIATARSQAVQYDPALKEAFAWWTREFIDGLRVEMGIPPTGTSVRTILIFAQSARNDRPAPGDHIYFEIPDGIQQIETLKTEAHLFLFDALPNDPWTALQQARQAPACYKCITRGVENKQGNRELTAHWQIEANPRPVLKAVPGQLLRPNTRAGLQQVRAEVESAGLTPFEYLFEREKTGWEPVYAKGPELFASTQAIEAGTFKTGRGKNREEGWKLVVGLSPLSGVSGEKDAIALTRATPDSGAFILVSLRRRELKREPEESAET